MIEQTFVLRLRLEAKPEDMDRKAADVEVKFGLEDLKVEIDKWLDALYEKQAA